MHLRSAGHRYVAYRAANVLGVPDAEALAGLDEALHVHDGTLRADDGALRADDGTLRADDEPAPAGTWLRRDALPWLWRRLHGRTAGDGRSAKHAGYIVIPRPGTRDRAPQG